jgi:hypothetical protein
MARPDFQGGESRLGLWNLYGRLLNEGPYAALELRLDLLRPAPGTDEAWTSVHAKVEGGTVFAADSQNGSLTQFKLSQLYVQAGNVLLKDVVWQLGTLDSYFGDLGLYDMRPAQIFYQTVGLSGRYQGKRLELLLGFGDSGFAIRGTAYSTILTFGGTARLRLAGGHLELGAGGQLLYEPQVDGNSNAPYRTELPANASYADFYRKEILARFLEENPGQIDRFPKPSPTSNFSYKLVAYLGFGGLGRLVWNNLFANFILLHPDTSYNETSGSDSVRIYTSELTNQRYQLNIGNELQLNLIRRRLDLVWAMLFGYYTNLDNTIVASEDNRIFYSTVLRLQCYLTETLHALGETSLAQERSQNGNLWRGHYDSIFTSSNGRSNTEGLEYGDQATRNTFQLKVGLVLNPSGLGVYTRPSIRLLYGLQYSSMHDAFGNSFSQSLDQFNTFAETSDRHWHSIVALEAEAWF